MKCPLRQHENLLRKVPRECGALLSAVGATCGAPNAPAQKLSGECGAALWRANAST